MLPSEEMVPVCWELFLMLHYITWHMSGTGVGFWITAPHWELGL